MRGASIGFRPLTTPKANDLGGYDFGSVELLEWSLVPVPANPDALRRSVGGKSYASREVPDHEVPALIARALDAAEKKRKTAALTKHLDKLTTEELKALAARL